MSSEEDVNPYDVLGLTIEATEQEIKTAYRQRSLKVHPDRVSCSSPLCSRRTRFEPLCLTSPCSKNRGNPDAGVSLFSCSLPPSHVG